MESHGPLVGKKGESYQKRHVFADVSEECDRSHPSKSARKISDSRPRLFRLLGFANIQNISIFLLVINVPRMLIIVGIGKPGIFPVLGLT